MLAALQETEGLNCRDKFVLLIFAVIISEAVEGAVCNNSEILFVVSHVCSHSQMMPEWHLRLSEVSYISQWPS